jgi:HK97 family phage prohead protease
MAEFVKAEGSDNKFQVTMSTASEDRHGDIVEQNWDLKAFKKNNVLVDSHNYESIDFIIGRVLNPKVKDNKLVGEIEFALDNPRGLMAYKLALGGFLNATSVGFIPLEFNDEGNISKSELLELSAVSVPANAEALIAKHEKDEKNFVEEIKEDHKEVAKLVNGHARLDALKRLARKKELRKKEIVKESLAVLQQMSQREVDTKKGRQMATRVIRQMLKVK